ncbi:fmn-dependent dehydrogenase family [Fusarium beomiforme]|uniref:Fmn-dependent dehydrogenase family n=1 Tax=Fusarium beomiforme TaxID=44412 RepID=A0A9P5DWE8_9HYPO|nr:fmn-dependent dehydrogenase family [Fusarium beomiforme]
MANRGVTIDPRNEIHCIQDLKEKGGKKLPRMYREFYDQGLRDNEDAFNQYKLRPRILRDVSNIDPSTTIAGIKVSFPFGFSPAAAHRVAHPDGEIGTSSAAAKNNIPMALSAYGTTSMEDVIAVGDGNPYFMQLNMLKNKEITKSMAKRAEASGYHGIILTADAPTLGIRLNEARNNLGMPSGIQYPNFLPGQDMSNLALEDDPLAYDQDCSLTWAETIKLLRSYTKLPIWVKGVYTPEDVELAINHGFDGVIISNHGRIFIAIDGGIRRGTDIFKALALGADFCFAGRIPIWGLAWNGEAGVDLAIKLLYREFRKAMILTGVTRMDEISRVHLSVLNAERMLSKL